MPPHRLARGHPVAGHDLVLAALLLRVEEIAVDGERRPARPDRPAPQLDRRRCDQSVSIRTPRTTPSRSGPRKPGHSARLTAAAGSGRFCRAAAGCRRRGASAFGAWLRVLLAPALRSAARRRRGRAERLRRPACASSRSSAVGVHRQWKSDRPSPLMPPVRTSIHGTAPEQDGDDHRRARGLRRASRRVATAQPTSARLSVGNRAGCNIRCPSPRRRSTGGRQTVPRPPRRSSGRSRRGARTSAPG